MNPILLSISLSLLLAGLASAEGRPVGDAFSDPENPIRKIWGGERLDLWSLKKPVRTAPPAGLAQQNPIDAFLLAKLAEKKLEFSPEADRRTLIRRLFFDLTGLPPSPAEVRAFVANSSPRAYEELVDQLLASPRYGERWARHWLDVVRYADTNGHERDEFRPEMWRYRDYIIRSFNEDKPYDRFIREQLAGDELLSGPPRTAAEADLLIATGFLRAGTYDSTASIFQEEKKARNELMADLVNTTGSAFLGLTFSCANCHDHKHDPISQADHFRFRAFFAAVQARDDLPLDLAPQQEAIKAHNAAIDARAAGIQKNIDTLLGPIREQRIAERRAKLPMEIQELLHIPEAKRDDATRKKLQPHLDALKVTDKEIIEALDAAVGKRHSALQASLDALKKERRAFITAHVMTDTGKPAETTRIFYQGDPNEPREEVQPGFLSVFDPAPAVIRTTGGQTLGRRLTLADWIASSDNPFTARVLVNRLWQHHFGVPLFGNPNDLGRGGPKPTHPELLDWLATEMIASGWSMKAMHRLMVTSAAYRQAGVERRGGTLGHAMVADPSNRLFWRQNARRLDAETMRDTLLAVAGKLRAHAGGPALWPPLPDEILRAQPGVLEALEGKDGGRRQGWFTSPEDACDVRTLYLIQKRSVPLPFLQAFDLPDTTASCARRDVTTVAPQALNLLNSDFALRVATQFAERVVREAGADCVAQIDHAVWLALGRGPTAEEQRKAAAFLAAQGEGSLPNLCRALLNLNEFVYID
jgi:hypothetical protein